MRSYLVRGNTISPSIGAVTAPADGIVLTSVADLDGRRFPLRRIVALCNALPSARPGRSFKNREAASKHLWETLEKLPLGQTRPNSKQARIVELLERSSGATLAELMSATGWQAHSVRGAISGAIRKKLGLTVVVQTEAGRRFYRVV